MRNIQTYAIDIARLYDEIIMTKLKSAHWTWFLTTTKNKLEYAIKVHVEYAWMDGCNTKNDRGG